MNLEETKMLRYDRAYLRLAKNWAMLSYCERKKVGAIIVKDGVIISDGYNGTPSGLIIFAKQPLEKLIGTFSTQKRMPF